MATYADNTRTTRDGKVTALPARYVNKGATRSLSESKYQSELSSGKIKEGDYKQGGFGGQEDLSPPAITQPTEVTEAGTNPTTPSPQSVNVGAGLPGATHQFDAKTGAPLAPGASTTDALGNTFKQGSPYQQGHAQLAGTQAPQDAGQAMMLAKGAMPPALPDMSSVDTLLMEDKGWQSLMQAKEDYFNPENQKTSLMDTYNKLYKKSGLEQLDEEIIDAKTVIEGTEDDIRNEIEQAGGFGSDSQVQALALSRNKVLLKNYNNLVALRESKSEHLGTMMNLAEKDRAYADTQFDRMLNFDMQMLNFREKFVQNARDQYNKYTPQQLTAMLAGNPRQLAFAESIMGVGPGGLQKLASMPLSESDQLDLDIKRGQLDVQKSNLLTDKAQRENIYSEINKRNQPEQEEDLLSYVTAYQGGQIPLTQVPQKIRGQVLAQVQSSGYNKMLDLLGQYKDKMTGLNFFSANSPTNKALLGSLKGQITAEYKQQKQLGTLDAGVQNLIDQIIPDPSNISISSLNNTAQVEALNNFIKNQGGGSTPAPDGSGDTVIITD